jgi:aldose 1-epimerase
VVNRVRCEVGWGNIPSVRARGSSRAASCRAALAIMLALGCSKTEAAPDVAVDQRKAGAELGPLQVKKVELRAPAVLEDTFGELDGKPVERFTLTNQKGLSLQVITYGAILTSLRVPDRDGKLADVVLGFDDIQGYVAGSPYFGAIVGRVANRIRGAAFELDGQRHTLAANNGKHHLHGGKRGFDKLLWSAEPASDPSLASLRLSLVSKDGDEGYPGTLTASVTYTLTNENELDVDMRATTDRATLVNLAQHSYFNLGGAGSGNVAQQELTLFADAYTPGDPQIPDGRVADVQGTPFDFTRPKAIGQDLAAAGLEPRGYDHSFVVRGDPHAMRPVARAYDPESGRVLTLDADQPGVQLYTGNHLDGRLKGKGSREYPQHAGFCLETQVFPDAVNVPAWREDVILRPGREYRHHMLYRFSTEPAAAHPP